MAKWIRNAVAGGCWALAMLVGAGCAQAAIMTGTFSGMIYGAIGNADALFGTSGGIDGLGIAGSYQYDTSLFGSPSVGLSNSYGSVWYPGDNSLQASAVAISLTINGHTLNFTGSYYNAMAIVYGCPGSASCGGWNYSTWSQAFELISEDNIPISGANAAQINLGRLDNNASLTNPALDPNGPFDFTRATVQANAAGWYDPNTESMVTWNFNITSFAVPEPASFGLLAAGLLGLRACRRRR